MKKLTLNRLAGAGIRANWRNYLSLSVGIFASIFLICSVILLGFSVYAGVIEKIYREVGKQNAIILDAEAGDAEELNTKKLAKQTGIVTILGEYEDVYLGFSDETAEALTYRQLFSGRLPTASGEIAIEMETLETLFPNAEPGDILQFSVTPIDGYPEEREYLLTGILLPQNDWYYNLNEYYPNHKICVPEMLLYREEAPFETGRTVQNIRLTFPKGVSLNDITAALPSAAVIGFDSSGWLYLPGAYTPSNSIFSPFMEEGIDTSSVFLAAVLVGSLLLFALCGISSSLDSQLDRKKEQIAMLRAVGATKKQIRQIFGRESILLALLLSPAAILASVLCVYVVCRYSRSRLCFHLPPIALVLMLVISFLFVMAASFFPLWSSAKQNPMGVIRDTKTLRKAKKFHSRNFYRPTFLLAIRKLRLHPLRHISAGILTGVFCLSMFVAVIVGGEAVQVLTRSPWKYDFNIYREHWHSFGDYRTPISEIQLQDADIDQIRSIPYVRSVETIWKTTVILDMEEYGDYLNKCRDFGVMYHTVPNEGISYEAARRVLQPEGSMFSIDVMLTDFPEAFTDYITEGAFHRDALDSGQEILVFAPDYYIIDRGSQTYGISLIEPSDGICEEHIVLDSSFAVGQTLFMNQMAADPDDGSNTWQYDTLEDCLQYYRNASLYKGSAVIGGIIRGNEITEKMNLFAPVIITTPQGLENIGLRHSEISTIQIVLDRRVDLDTEEQTENRLTRIASRGSNLKINNLLAMTREDKQASSGILLVSACLLAAFLSISVNIISGNCVRQMQAEQKTIGTLRALGMNGRELIRGYSGEALLSVCFGAFFGMTASQCLTNITNSYVSPLFVIGCSVVAASLTGLLCCLKISRRGKVLLDLSIIDNIREV